MQRGRSDHSTQKAQLIAKIKRQGRNGKNTHQPARNPTRMRACPGTMGNMVVTSQVPNIQFDRPPNPASDTCQSLIPDLTMMEDLSNTHFSDAASSPTYS